MFAVAALTDFVWHSESDEPQPAQLIAVDDRLTADEALKRVRRHEFLLYQGDFHNARQLLQAMSRRLPHPVKAKSLADAFRAERLARHREHETLSRIVVEITRDQVLQLSRAPDVKVTCQQIFGRTHFEKPLVLPFKTLLGMVSATQFRATGLPVAGLKKPLIPHYGVYLPTRHDYLKPVLKLRDLEGRTAFDIGTGSGVLSFLLLERGVTSVHATDLDARAVACAKENAAHLGLAKRFHVKEQRGFPSGTADIVICNPPWVPEVPKNRVDRAVFDENSQMLIDFLQNLSAHLNAGGRGVLLISNLAELLELRLPAWLPEEIARAGLQIESQISEKPSHSRAKDKGDPLHAARMKEVTTMYVLTRKP